MESHTGGKCVECPRECPVLVTRFCEECWRFFDGRCKCWGRREPVDYETSAYLANGD